MCLEMKIFNFQNPSITLFRALSSAMNLVLNEGRKEEFDVTSNQISFWELQEKERSNRASEAIDAEKNEINRLHNETVDQAAADMNRAQSARYNMQTVHEGYKIASEPFKDILGGISSFARLFM